MNWSKGLVRILKGDIHFNEPLSKHTTFKVGGPADVWVEPFDLEDLAKIVKLAKNKKKKFFIIGNGSNILVKDKGYRGIVVKLNSAPFQKIRFGKNTLTAGSAVSLRRMALLAKNNGLSGCEFLSHIPGTLGGALIANAGVSWTPEGKGKRQDISDLVTSVEVLGRDGQIKILDRKKINFGYRHSDLSKYIITSATLRLKAAKKSEITKRMREFHEYRDSTQRYEAANAGCIFKNPKYPLGKTNSNAFGAGKLIDLCGLKGERIGGAYVSQAHANFIINDGRAKAEDILRLMKIIRSKVREKFNIVLEPEIKIIGG